MDTPEPDAGWITRFKASLVADPTASKAWKALEFAGLVDGALRLLYGYRVAANDTDAMHQRALNVNRLIKAAIRADKIARTRAPKRSHDPDLFVRRAREAQEAALAAEWPVPATGILTLRDELERMKSETGKEWPPLKVVREVLVEAAGKRSPINRFYFLLLLQGYARHHGVELGTKRLVALAGAAGHALDEGTLGHYLRSLPESLKKKILRDALPALPPPASREARN